MALVVRWLGAFGRNHGGLSQAVNAELTGIGRQVAAEPCFFGESRLSRKEAALIGLRINLDQSVFIKGWLGDAWTVRKEDGTLYAAREKKLKGKTFSDLGRLIKAAKPFTSLKNEDYKGHGEVCIDYPKYDAIVVCRHAGDEVKAKAQALAKEFNLAYQIVVRRHWSGKIL